MADHPIGDHYGENLAGGDAEEYDLTMKHVDVNGAPPTEDDEMDVLRELYGEPDEDGVFRGPGEDDSE